jgi:hypothetical protein
VDLATRARKGSENSMFYLSSNKCQVTSRLLLPQSSELILNFFRLANELVVLIPTEETTPRRKEHDRHLPEHHVPGRKEQPDEVVAHSNKRLQVFEVVKPQGLVLVRVGLDHRVSDLGEQELVLSGVEVGVHRAEVILGVEGVSDDVEGLQLYMLKVIRERHVLIHFERRT